jgi:hypothetical protein
MNEAVLRQEAWAPGGLAAPSHPAHAVQQVSEAIVLLEASAAAMGGESLPG